MHLQVDYESEEEEEEEGKEDQCELEEEGAKEESLQESQPEATPIPPLRRREKRKEGKHEGNTTQMRVNAVLQSNPAIQRYCFDQQQELWCEVGIITKHHIPSLILQHIKA